MKIVSELALFGWIMYTRWYHCLCIHCDQQHHYDLTEPRLHYYFWVNPYLSVRLLYIFDILAKWNIKKAYGFPWANWVRLAPYHFRINHFAHYDFTYGAEDLKPQAPDELGAGTVGKFIAYNNMQPQQFSHFSIHCLGPPKQWRASPVRHFTRCPFPSFFAMVQGM